jgi:hypothetical protein
MLFKRHRILDTVDNGIKKSIMIDLCNSWRHHATVVATSLGAVPEKDENLENLLHIKADNSPFASNSCTMLS